jgi:hypothetical protein
VFANIGVTVFDGQSSDIRKNPNANLQGIMIHLAASLTEETMHELDNSAFPASPPEAANNATLHDTARAFLAGKLDKALPAYFKE